MLTKTVLMFVPKDWLKPPTRELYVGELIPALRSGLAEARLVLQVIRLRSDNMSNDAEQIMAVLETKTPAGVIVCRAASKDDALLTYLSDREVPFVVYGSPEPKYHAWSVDIDNASVFADLTARVIALGHERVAMFNGVYGASYSQARLDGFMRAHRDAGLHIHEDLIFYGTPTSHYGAAMAGKLLTQQEAPTAIVCATDEIALGAASVVESLGFEVGRQISITGYGALSAALDHQPSIATARYRITDAADAIVERIQAARGGFTAGGQQLIPAEFVPGESLAHPDFEWFETRVLTSRSLSQTALERRVRQLERVVGLAEVGSWTWDVDDRKFVFSADAMQLLGAVEPRSRLSSTGFMACFDEQSQLLLAEAWTEARATGSIEITLKLVATHFDQYLKFSGATVFDSENKLIFGEGALIDVSEVEENYRLSKTLYEQVASSNQQLNATLRVLEERDAKQRQLYSIIEHELRAPAASIYQLSTMKGFSVSHEVFSTLTRQLLNVIDDMRAIAEPDVELATSTTPFDLEGLVDDLANQAGKFLEDGGFSLLVEKKLPGPLLLLGDSYRIGTIVSNFIRNAYFHSQGTKISLCCSAEKSGSCYALRLAVEDNGTGIPLGKVDGLFEPYARGDTSAAGTGLGLHIAREWAEKMGGQVDYAPVEFGGSRFTLFLELPEVPLAQGRMASDIDNTCDGVLLGRRVLIAEDDKVSREILISVLSEEFDVQCVGAKNGQEALDAALSAKFDIVLADHHMPSLSGPGLVTALKQYFPDLPVIGMTAATMGKERDALLAAGSDAVLSKPVDMDELEGLMCRLLGSNDDEN